jgi:hypothetical protein
VAKSPTASRNACAALSLPMHVLQSTLSALYTEGWSLGP